MNTRVDVFCTPKGGSKSTECEDAWFVEPDRASSIQRFAIADGATDSVFSGLWARLLVDAFGQNMLDGYDSYDFFDLLSFNQQEWQRKVDRRGNLPWYVEEKAKKGAFSTLLRLTLYDNFYWEAFAVGDSCLFHVRDEKIIERFPLTDSSSFGSSPFLISSKPSSNRGLFNKIHGINYRWMPYDIFYLMTDAVACWFMQSDERGFQPTHLIRDLSQRGFESLIEMLRHENLIRNDDSTIIRVELLDF